MAAATFPVPVARSGEIPARCGEMRRDRELCVAMIEQSAVTEFQRSFKVGKFTIALRVTLVAGKPAEMRTEWEPYYPGGLGGQLFRKYRQRRDACLAALAEQLGGAILSIDEAGMSAVHPDGRIEAIREEGGQMSAIPARRAPTLGIG